MKKMLFCALILLLASCSSPLSKKFNPDTYGSDIAEIGEKSQDDMDLISSWVLSHSLGGNTLEINGLTYEHILESAKKEKKEKQQKLDKFYNTKFTTSDTFIKELQTLVNENLITVDSDEAQCIGFFCSYKEKEGSITKMTYKQIIDQAPAFCKEHDN